MPQANLSETLFRPRARQSETSTLVRRRADQSAPPQIQFPLDGKHTPRWYRMINPLMWAWRGVDPQEILEVQARIVMSNARRSDEKLYDTVVGYHSGNWIFEWAKQAMHWQQKASQTEALNQSGRYWLHAANLYSIAAWPHLKGDALAEQAQTLANRAWQQATRRLNGEMREIEFVIPQGPPVTGFLHMPKGDGPFPTVLMCGGLDSLQMSYYTLYEKYFAPRSIAMLTLDMPSMGFSSKWKLTQDSSFLHQHALKSLATIPWIDPCRVAAFGLRFGANIAVRLAYLEAARLKAVACLGPVVHTLFTDPCLQKCVPEMYLDMLASRLGMHDASNHALRAELSRYSLKTQGLLGRRCSTPMLSGFWKDDLFSPKSESCLITSSSAEGKLLSIPSSPVYHNFDHALEKITGWINDKLC